MTRRELYHHFLSEFPLETLANLPIDRYTNLNREDAFCYWLESKSEDLGSILGSSSFKFGIYQYQNKPSENPKYLSDGTYAWLKKLGNSHSEAYSKVIEDVVRIAQTASQGRFDEIDTDDYAVAPIVRWKIAFLYSNERLIPVYKKEMLAALAAHYGMTEPEKTSQAELNAFLLERKGDKDLFEFYDELTRVLEKITPAKDVSDSDAVTEDQKLMERLISELGTREPFNGYDELYKWQLLDETDGKDNLGIVRSLFSTTVVYPIGYNNLFKNLCEREPQKLSERLDALFDENVALDTRVNDFKTGVRDLYSGNMKRLADDERTVASLLTCKYPDRYTFYQFDVYQHICNYFGYAKQPVGKRFSHFMRIINAFAAEYGEQVQQLFATQIEKFNHKPLNLAIQTLFWCMKDFMKSKLSGSTDAVSKNEYEALMDKILEQNPTSETSNAKKYIRADFLSEVYMNGEDHDRLSALLKEKKNIILQGAPGVGKTFSAERLAYSLMGEKDDSRVTFVQFHQNYSYEDFVMGYKPTENGGFELKNGVFYKACIQAQNDPDKDYFFIIDEINRGNLSKIFGELLMLIENDYRGKEVTLAYNGEQFSVPKNLYIIGMMNTADRSLALIDYALRRRFSFFEMRPGFDTDGFKTYQKSLGDETFDEVIKGIKELNTAIEKDDSLGSGFCIGHSYFCGKTSVEKGWLRNVIDFDIAPMLREYWFDDKTRADAEIKKLEDTVK